MNIMDIVNTTYTEPLEIWIDTNTIISQGSAFHLLDLIYRSQTQRKNISFYIFEHTLNELKHWYIKKIHLYPLSHISSLYPFTDKILELINSGVINTIHQTDEEKRTHLDAVILSRLIIRRNHSSVLLLSGDKALCSDAVTINKCSCSKSKHRILAKSLQKIPLPFTSQIYFNTILRNWSYA